MDSITFNRLSENSYLKGQITVSGDFYVAGTIEGNINLHQTGLLLIEPSGSITGDVECIDLQILGKIQGNIRAEGQVTIKSSGHVIGTIHAKGIKILPGATIESQLEIQENFDS